MARRRMVLIAALAVTSGFEGHAWAAQPNDQAKSEIAHLLAFVEASECQFNRNGNWYSSAEAASHIQRKYEYVLEKGMVSNAEDFIRLAATQSSYSGKVYTVRCGTETLTSADWLKEALRHFRQPSG